MYKLFFTILMAVTLCLHDAIAQNWKSVAQMSSVRFGHSSVMLNDGRILIAGGGLDAENIIANAEIFDYRDNSLTELLAMSEGRVHHEALLLNDGRVLIAGGAGAFGIAINSCQIFDPQTNTWSSAASMLVRRERFTMVKLNDGRILASGGIGGASADQTQLPLLTSEIYDPASDTWELTAAMPSARSGHQAVNLADGRVLVTSGLSTDGNSRKDCDIYDPQSDSWMETGAFFRRATSDHRMSLLRNGQVLRTGGRHAMQALNTSEIYDPATGEWLPTNQMRLNRFAHAQLTLANNNLLVLGGTTDYFDPQGGDVKLAAVEEFIQELQFWRFLEPLPRELHWLTAHYTPDGHVIVIGGASLDAEAQPSEPSAEIFSRYYGTFETGPRVRGAIHYDFNGNGMRDTEDYPARFVKLEARPGPYYFFTDEDGKFDLVLPTGQYAICISESANWSASRTGSNDDCYDITIQDANEIVAGIDFMIVPAREIEELDVCIVGSRALPGQNVEYDVIYTNSGTVPFSGEVFVNFGPVLEFVGSSSPPNSRPSQQSAGWEVSYLQVGSTAGFRIKLAVPDDNRLLEQELCLSAEYQPAPKAEQLLRNGRDQFCSVIREKHEAIEMIATPRGVGPEGEIEFDNSTLSYMLYFQNCGPDSVHRVQIEIPIDADLDISSFEFGLARELADIKITPDRILTFTFNDIVLPQKSVNEADSRRFVRFYIKPLGPQQDKVEIENSANIYFESDPPIKSNSVVNTLTPSVTSVNNSTAKLITHGLQVKPNPAGTTFEVVGLKQLPQTVKLVDLYGRAHRVSFQLSGSRLVVNSAAPASGSYWLSLAFADGRSTIIPLIIAR